MSPPTLPVVAVGGIAFDEGGRVLLVQRGKPPSQGLWTVPGGRVELGETLREACVRELREETGYEGEAGEVVEVLDRVVTGAGGAIEYHYVIVDFLVEVRGGALCASSDVADARWCDADELRRLPLTEGLEPVVERARTLASRGDKR